MNADLVNLHQPHCNRHVVCLISYLKSHLEIPYAELMLNQLICNGPPCRGFSVTIRYYGALYTYSLNFISDDSCIDEYNKLRETYGSMIDELQFTGESLIDYQYCTARFTPNLVVQKIVICGICKRNVCQFCSEECHFHGNKSERLVNSIEIAKCQCGSVCQWKQDVDSAILKTKYANFRHTRRSYLDPELLNTSVLVKRRIEFDQNTPTDYKFINGSNQSTLFMFKMPLTKENGNRSDLSILDTYYFEITINDFVLLGNRAFLQMGYDLPSSLTVTHLSKGDVYGIAWSSPLGEYFETINGRAEPVKKCSRFYHIFNKAPHFIRSKDAEIDFTLNVGMDVVRYPFKYDAFNLIQKCMYTTNFADIEFKF